MLILSQLHTATNVGAGNATTIRGRPGATLKTHTVEYLCDSGTGNATVIHYGRNGTNWVQVGGALAFA